LAQASILVSNIVFTLAVPDKTGASRMVFQFSGAMVRGGHKVLVVHGPEPSGPDRSIVPQLKSAGAGTVLETGLGFPLDPRLPGRVAQRASKHAAHCIIGVNQRDRAVALSAARRLSVPGIVCAQNQHVFWGPWPAPFLKESFYAHSMRRNADLIVCTSPVVQDEFVKRFRVNAGQTRCLSNGVDVFGLPRFSPAELSESRRQLGFGDHDVMMINVGRTDAQKGLDILVESLRMLDDSRPARLIQIGDVTDGAARSRGLAYRQKLQQQVHSYGLENRISFIGWREDVPQLLQAADMYVHAARWEGSPLSVIEAMAAGIAVITPNNTSRPEGFADGIHGLVVPPESPQALASAMNKMLRMNREDRRSMGLAARSLAETRYDIGTISEQFMTLIEGVIAGTERTICLESI
jgi:glycosyltransferase involved in cell wall biosynthesis